MAKRLVQVANAEGLQVNEVSTSYVTSSMVAHLLEWVVCMLGYSSLILDIHYGFRLLLRNLQKE